jgi:hypothetical protein
MGMSFDSRWGAESPCKNAGKISANLIAAKIGSTQA